MKIYFIKDKDGKTMNMYSSESDVCLDYDIPYIPERLVDHRAMAVRAFCGLKKTSWKNIEGLDETTINGLRYLDNPIYVKIAIKRKEKTKSFSF